MEALKRKADHEKERNHFVIDNAQKANWALRKIKHLKKKKNKNKDFAEKEIEVIEAEIEEIRNWLDTINGSLDKDISYMEGLLRVYAEKLKEDDPELKTHKLPFGKLQFRKQRDKWEYDNQKLIEFAEKNLKEAIKISKRVDKRILKNKVKVVGDKAVVAQTGEVVAGVKVIERGEKFKVKV